ncbi:MAG TPA: hypothetical protein VFJ50_00460 [Gemmatimonadales bacterium]|nr:hypothetical protein [Gemmatimonadales bacterium]
MKLPAPARRGTTSRSVVAAAGGKASGVLGRSPEPALLLVGDLRLLDAEASISWAILSQGVQAVRDRELLDLVAGCRAQTLHGTKWTVTRLKTAAPQVWTS